MKAKVLFFFLLSCCVLTARAEKPEIPDSARLQLALKKLTVVGSVLYVGAHPDDENTAVLSYLSLGRSVRTGYLSITRGDGGQNLLGPEQSELLGKIRTEELLAARQIDDAEQFFTRAVDFGYTKSPDETIQFWGKENILSDIVWILRTFRPDVVINRFTKEGGGHGQHTASAILSEEAFQMAGDPTKFPEQLKYVKVWQPKRLLWNRYSFGGREPSEQEKAASAKMEIGDYNPILGKSYTEIAGLSRSMHKSQGMGDSEDRGQYTNYFQTIAGDTAKTDVLEGIDLSWKRIPGGDRVGVILEQAYRSFRPENPAATVPLLLQAHSLMQSLPDPAVEQKKQELLKVLKDCAGLWLDAIASESSSTPGNDIKITVSALNRSDLSIQLDSIQINSTNVMESSEHLKNNAPFTKEMAWKVPASMPYTQPYWLEKTPEGALYQVTDAQLIGRPESQPPFIARFRLTCSGQQLLLEEPVLYRWIDPIDGERYRVFEVAPEVSIHLKQSVTVFTDNKPKTIDVSLTSRSEGTSGELKLQLPSGWISDPSSVSFQFSRKEETLNFPFLVHPAIGASRARFLAIAMLGPKKISTDLVTINYPHIPPQTVLTPAQGILLPIDLKKTGMNIAYIVGSGDSIPDSLEQVGYHVTLLSNENLAAADFSGYDALVLGIRAYNTRQQLAAAQPKLLDYVKNGGTMVVQYNTPQELVLTDLGPFPFSLSRDRVSVENAPVSILAPENPLLNFPNKITSSDFEGWIQERGLNFPDKWDAKYETVIACNDPGESPKAGGILYAHYGKGTYIYTSYSWFRQLPAGVAGAYRLFVNLISAGKK